MWLRIRRYFLSGLVIFLPLALTVYLFVLTINFSDGILGKFLKPFFLQYIGFYPRGISIIIGFLAILLIGFLATNYFGRKLHSFFERIVVKLPFFKQVYPAIKEIALFLFTRDRLAFRQVVMVEYPRPGIYSFGFLTNETCRKACELTGKELYSVFIPSAPGPFTGYVIMVPKKQVIITDFSVEETIKYIVSGGVVNPIDYSPPGRK